MTHVIGARPGIGGLPEMVPLEGTPGRGVLRGPQGVDRSLAHTHHSGTITHNRLGDSPWDIDLVLLRLAILPQGVGLLQWSGLKQNYSRL